MKKAPRQSRRSATIARVSAADLYSARKGEADVIFTVYCHMFDQTAPQGFIELRDVFRKFLQSGDVNFWHDGLSPNFLSVTLKEEQIRQLRDFFQSCSETIPDTQGTGS